jgi:drug/metabolite transporter (DMT)-like permease
MTAFVALWTAVELIAAAALSRYSPFQVVWMRYGVHLALMLAIWGWRAPTTLWHTRRPVYQSVRAFLMVVMPASWALAMQAGVPEGRVTSIFWISPLLVVALSRPLLGERPSATSWGAAMLGCAGAWTIHGMPRLPSPAWLTVLPLAMAASFSMYFVMTRSLRSDAVRVNLFYTAVVPFVILSPVMPGVWRTPAALDVGLMVTVGLLGYLTLYALDRAAAGTPVADTGAALALQAALVGAVEWWVGPGAANGAYRLGSLLILASVGFVWWRAAWGAGVRASTA